jgi:hypothetical protein
MNVVNRRVARFAALALLALTLSACGDDEPGQRKAFIEFLQTQIINRSGVHVPALNDADKKNFGGYTAHYAVITDFVGDAGMMAMSRKINDALPPVQSIQALVEQRAVVRKAGGEIGGLVQVMEEKYAKTKTARDALKQPDDLKIVYNAAFDKLIGAPLRGFEESTPIAQAITIAAANLGDYVAAHGDSVKIVGTSLQAKDKKTQAEIDALVNALNSNAGKFNEAQRKLRIVLQGS